MTNEREKKSKTRSRTQWKKGLYTASLQCFSFCGLSSLKLWGKGCLGEGFFMFRKLHMSALRAALLTARWASRCWTLWGQCCPLCPLLSAGASISLQTCRECSLSAACLLPSRRLAPSTTNFLSRKFGDVRTI